MKWRFYNNWRGKQILQVKIPGFGEFASFWKDATLQEGIEFTVEMEKLKEKYDIVKKNER